MAKHDLTPALVPTDAAFTASEAKWGVGRLERLVSETTLMSYRKGWTAYRKAIEDGDILALQAIGPKMVAALAYMDREATTAGHQPLAVDVWEATLTDGTVLAIVKTMPEAHALVASKNGRQRLIYSLAEVARIIEHYEIANAVKLSFPGATIQPGEKVVSGVQLAEGRASDWARDDPMYDLLHGAAA